MKTRWPLGLGNYTRSVVHTFVTGGIGVFALLVTMIACLEAGDHSVDKLRFAASCRTWGLLLLAVFSSQGAMLYLLRPGVLRL